MTQKKGKVVFGSSNHPWLDPLWRRIGLVLFCAGWTGVEVYHGSHTWALIFAAITAYAVWAYLIDYSVHQSAPSDKRQDPESSD